MMARGLERVLMVLMICFAWVPTLVPAQVNDSIEGKLSILQGKGAWLQSRGREVRLTSDDPDLIATLEDTRLSGRAVKLEGDRRDDGSFKVHKLFVVRPDGLYRLIYFCEVCNIATFRPGPCACCQAPVEPIEVKPTDPRIHQETKP